MTGQVQYSAYLEVLGIIFIIGLEFYYFLIVYNKINLLTNLYPMLSDLSILEKEVDQPEYSEINEAIESNASQLQISTNQIFTLNPSSEFNVILHATNTYLENNRSGVVDFNIVKDISESVNDSVERNISSMISIPLYIGLLGTIAGIIYSLFNLDLEAIAESGSIAAFLEGVKIAMFANFFGLFFTLLNSSFFMKKAVYSRDLNKAGYYSFIQSHLLPKVSTDIASSIKGLQSTLNNFNVHFSQNIGDFNSNTERVSQNLKDQNKLLNTLERLGLDKIVEANLLLFGEFNKNVGTFEQFISNQSNLISQFDQFKSAIFKADQMMQNVYDMKSYIESSLSQLNDRVEGADQLLHFLRSQYSGIQNISDSTSIFVSEQNSRIESLFETYQSFLNDLIKSNNSKVERLIEDSEENIKQLVLDKNFLSLSTNIKTISKELPSIQNNIQSINKTVGHNAANIENVKIKLDQKQVNRLIKLLKTIGVKLRALFVKDNDPK